MYLLGGGGALRAYLVEPDGTSLTSVSGKRSKLLCAFGNAQVGSCSSREHHHRNNRPAAARTGAILASVSRADFALALRKAFQSPSARWCRRSVR